MDGPTEVVDAFAGKRVVVIGLARQGKALARFAAQQGADVVVTDRQPVERLAPSLAELADLEIEAVLGEHPMSLLADADILAISGGVPSNLPIVKAAREQGVEVTNDSLEFMKRCPAPVVGITGSAGKTTTTALTGAMASQAGNRTWVGGNIGRPLITDLDEMSASDVVVQELSSFQLELWDRSPRVAAVLNLTPNHLDRHGTMEAYRQAKANILRHQGLESIAVLSADDHGSMSMTEFCPGRVRHFSAKRVVRDGAYLQAEAIWLSDALGKKRVCGLDEIRLRGPHNVLNVLASVTLADSIGVQPAAMREAIRAFEGVEHRLEPVRKLGGVQYVNDSIATAPERALAALAAFHEPLILLAGGRDKNMVWQTWAQRVNERVRMVVLFGELAPALEGHLARTATGSESGPIVRRVKTLAEAVLLAARAAEPGDVILLSPGGTSYDAYQDFAERGEEFRHLVNALAEDQGRRFNERTNA